MDRIERVVQYVNIVIEVLKPKAVIWCTGSTDEYNSLLDLMVKNGTLISLSRNRYLHRSHPTDVARTEQATYICAKSAADVGPLNNFMSYDQAGEILRRLLPDAYQGKTVYVVPYVMGSLESPWSQCGIEVTDSPYVAASMYLMTRVVPAKELRGRIVKSIHVSGNLDPKNKYILHFPYNEESKFLDPDIISLNSAYGGNALLNKKCHALRIASIRGKEEGWMAEHMLLLELITPENESYFIAGAFPSASGKTNLAMIKLPEEYEKKGWKAKLIGDDIAWIHPHNGRLHAINPENGFFGVVPGTNERTNPNAMNMMKQDVIFTNVGLTSEGEPWWEGLSPQESITDWLGKIDDHEPGTKFSHPNSRFTAKLSNYPHLSERVNDPYGVPLDIILFGGRRTDTVPLVYEPYTWEDGVLAAATMGVETTAAADGPVGTIRRDPMAMRPFCGYNINDYFDHWLEMGEIDHPPKIFYVNWFQKNSDGQFIWPGFGENIKVLEWAIQRTKNEEALETPLGYIPKEFPSNLFHIDKELWEKELESMQKFLESIGNSSLLPSLERLKSRFSDTDV